MTTSDKATLIALLRRFRESECSWFSTVRAEGRAHSVPIWHVVHADSIYLATPGDSVKVDNIRSHPGVVISHPDPVDPVIIEGEAEPAPEDRDAVRPGFEKKYGWDPDESPGYDTIIRIRPTKLMAWGKHGAGRWRGAELREALREVGE